MPDQPRTRYLTSKKQNFGSVPSISDSYSIGYVRLGRGISLLSWQNTVMRSHLHRHAPCWIIVSLRWRSWGTGLLWNGWNREWGQNYCNTASYRAKVGFVSKLNYNYRTLWNYCNVKFWFILKKKLHTPFFLICSTKELYRLVIKQ